MSDVAIGSKASDGGLFRGRTVALMLAIGVLGFVATLLLGAYAPDLRSGRNGGAHALSNAATGFRALVELARATDRGPRIVRSDDLFDTEDLLVVTPERASTDISAALRGRRAKPTLFILPKWRTTADPKHRGWVRTAGTLPLAEPIGVLAPTIRFGMRLNRTAGNFLESHDLPAGIRFREPRLVQVITGLSEDSTLDEEPVELRPLLTDRAGGVLLAQIGEGPLFVLADPDLLNNSGMKDPGQAASALALLDWMNSNENEGIAFDVSLNGLGRTKSPLKLIFEPPFLAITIGIAAALLLAGWQALARFGPIAPRERAIAFGKAALIDNSAALIRKARREARMGGRYAAMIRERAARAFGAPARLRDEALDAYLDGLKGPQRFTELAEKAASARDRGELLEATSALHAWQRDKMRNSK
jgi:hypothetical protein